MDGIKDEYKNSNRHKEEVKREQEKELKKVTTGAVKIKKKSGVERALGSFIKEDAGVDIQDYIINDLIIPTVKDGIMNIVGMLLGQEVNYSSKRNRKSSNNASRVSYRKYYDDDDDRRGRNKYHDDEYRGRISDGFDYDKIVYETRRDAEDTLNSMEDALYRYNIVTVGDLYDISGIGIKNYQTMRYGWSSLRSASVLKVRDGWMIKLPKPMPID